MKRQISTVEVNKVDAQQKENDSGFFNDQVVAEKVYKQILEECVKMCNRRRMSYTFIKPKGMGTMLMMFKEIEGHRNYQLFLNRIQFEELLSTRLSNEHEDFFKSIHYKREDFYKEFYVNDKHSYDIVFYMLLDKNTLSYVSLNDRKKFISLSDLYSQRKLGESPYLQ